MNFHLCSAQDVCAAELNVITTQHFNCESDNSTECWEEIGRPHREEIPKLVKGNKHSVKR
jgi:hypothetical protein